VADSRRSRDGRYIERIGFFNPIATGGEERLRINTERTEYWSSKGAQLSPRVSRLLKDYQQAQ
jgi:small subunit ribosomal protein S16